MRQLNIILKSYYFSKNKICINIICFRYPIPNAIILINISRFRISNLHEAPSPSTKTAKTFYFNS